MKIKLTVVFFLVVAAMSFSEQSAQASWPFSMLILHNVKKLVRSMNGEIERMDSGLKESSDGNNSPLFIIGDAAGSSWHLYMQVIRLRITPYVSFGLPGLVNLKVKPWLELEWNRKPPAGWENAIPQN